MGLPELARNDALRFKRAQEFYQRTGLPFCVGALDVTHVVIQRPAASHAYAYRDRHADFSIAMQAVVDANYRFQNVRLVYQSAVLVDAG